MPPTDPPTITVPTSGVSPKVADLPDLEEQVNTALADLDNNIRVDVDEQIAGQVAAAAGVNFSVDARVGSVASRVVGATDFSTIEASGSAQYSVPNFAFTNGGMLTDVSVHMEAAGEVRIYAYELKEGIISPVASASLDLLAGLSENVPVNIAIPVNGYVGVFSETIARVPAQWAEGRFFDGSSNFLDSTDTVQTSGSGYAITFNTLEYETLSNEAVRAGLGIVDTAVDAHTLFLRDLTLPNVIFAGIYGQDNVVGLEDGVTLLQSQTAQGFANKSPAIQPLRVSDQNNGKEFIGYGFAEYVQRALTLNLGFSDTSGISPTVVGRVSNVDAGVADFKEGENLFRYGQEQAETVVALAEANQTSVSHLGSIFCLGEGDASVSTPLVSFRNDVIEVAENLRDAGAELGLTDGDAPLFMFQASGSLWNGIDDGWRIVTAQKDATAYSGTSISLICPEYHLRHAGRSKLTAASARVAGAYAARAALAKNWDHLRVATSRVEGNSIILTYNRNIVLDTSFVPAQKDFGFSAVDGSDVAVDILSVTAGASTITLEFAADPSDYTWAYGRNVASDDMLPYAGGAGNVRDNMGDTYTFDGFAMHNPAILEDGPAVYDDFVLAPRTPLDFFLDYAEDFSEPESDAYTSFNGVLWQDEVSISDGALQFDGVDDYITLDADLSTLGNFTIATWVNKQAQTDNRVSLINQGALEVFFRGNEIFGGSMDGAVVETAANAIELGEWTHIAVTFDGTNLKGFINAVEVFSTDGILPNSAPIYVGVKNATLANKFQGYLDEIKIFNKAMPAEEILVAANIPSISVKTDDAFIGGSDALEIIFNQDMNLSDVSGLVVYDGLPASFLVYGSDTVSEIAGTWAQVDATTYTFTPTAAITGMAAVVLPKGFASASGDAFQREEVVNFLINPATLETVTIDAPVTYKTVTQNVGGTDYTHDIQLEVIKPDANDNGKTLIWIHGGAWSGGTETLSESYSAKDGEYLASLGYTCVSVGYRCKGSEGTIVQAYEDAGDAIDYIKANAATLGVPLTTLIMYGGSAGAPIAAQMAVTRADIDGFVGINGVYDFTDTGGGDYDYFDEYQVPRGRFAVSSGDYQLDTPTFLLNSPEHNITKVVDALLLHGNLDTTVRFEQSFDMRGAIEAASGSAELVVVKNEGHAFANVGKRHHVSMLHRMLTYFETIT